MKKAIVLYERKDVILRIGGRSLFVPVLWRVADRGSTVVKVLCYKSEGRWFDPSWWSTQPLTEMSTRSISWGVKAGA